MARTLATVRASIVESWQLWQSFLLRLQSHAPPPLAKWWRRTRSGAGSLARTFFLGTWKLALHAVFLYLFWRYYHFRIDEMGLTAGPDSGPSLITPEWRTRFLATEAFPIVLAYLALFVGVMHILGIDPQVKRLRSLYDQVVGLDNYVEQAVLLYRQRVTRVVTVLRHWISAGRTAWHVSAAIDGVAAEQVWFLGDISIDSGFFPGVIWRLNRVLQSPGRSRFRLYHISRGRLPLFVVSRGQHGGDLLLGRAGDGPLENYGIRLPSDTGAGLARFFDQFVDQMVNGQEATTAIVDGLSRVLHLMRNRAYNTDRERFIREFSGLVYEYTDALQSDERKLVIDRSKFERELRSFLEILESCGACGVKDDALWFGPETDLSTLIRCLDRQAMKARAAEGIPLEAAPLETPPVEPTPVEAIPAEVAAAEAPPRASAPTEGRLAASME